MSRASDITRALGGDWYRTYGKIPGPGHSTKDRSVIIKDSHVLDDGIFVHSFAGDDPLVIKDWLREQGLLPPRASRGSGTGRPSEKLGQSIHYIYRAANGTPYLRVTRRPGKKFYQSSWVDGRWVSGAPTGPKIPYRLPELLDAVHNTVFLVEGEKDVDALIALGFVATTCSGGANGWSDDLRPYFKGKDVYILPDNDEVGRAFAERAAASIYGVPESVRVCPLPELPDKGDVSDWLENGGDHTTLVEYCKSFQPWKIDDGTIGISELMRQELPPVDFIVPGLIPEVGLFIWGGKPKMGKSWAMLQLALAAAMGGNAFGVPCKKSRVLYAALEDNPQRIQERTWQLLGDESPPADLRLVFDVPVLDAGGMVRLRHLCDTHNITLLIIDVFARIRPAKRGGESEYNYDTRSMAPLQRLAHEMGIAVVVVHHLRKETGTDVLDRVSGSTGLTGVADLILTVDKREDGCFVWEGRGRDVEDISWAMKFEDGRWSLTDDVLGLTPDQQRVVDVLPPEPGYITPAEVAQRTGVPHDTVRQALTRLSKRGHVKRCGYGKYSKPSRCHSSEKDKKNQRFAV